MLTCPNCKQNIPDNTAFCPYCGALFDAPPPVQAKKPFDKNKLIIALCCIIIVLAILGATLAILFFSRKKPQANTFDLTGSQYISEVSRLTDKAMPALSSNGAHSVCSAETFTIDIDTDIDSGKITQIDVSPADSADAEEIASVTLIIIHPGWSRGEAGGKLPQFRTPYGYGFAATEDPHMPKKPDRPVVPAESVNTSAPVTLPSVQPTTAEPTTVAPTTEEPTTEPPTDPPTEPPTDPPTEPDNRYHNTKYGWSVEIPDEWFVYGTIQESDSAGNYLGTLGFYYAEAYGTKYGGHVFTIYAVPVNSKYDDGATGGNPAGGFLGRNSQYAFYWWKATDVQYDYTDEQERGRRSAEYRTLSDMRQTILNSFRIDG